MNISAVISQQTGEPKNNNTLAFCVDENYLPYALFVAEQFLTLHPELPCDICICLPDISKVPKKFINTQIRFVELYTKGIESLPVGKLSLAAYHRLFLPQIFEDTYKYIIYLDADTFINKPFYNDLIKHIDSFHSEFCVAAAADIMELRFRSTIKQKQGTVYNYIQSYHELNHIYRNSGVLVFNTKNYMKEDILSKIFDYAIENANSLQCHDQSALNRVLLNDIALLPFDFNWQTNKLTYKLTDSVEPYIIHFISSNKPWLTDNKYTAKYQAFYKDFLLTNFPEITLDILNMSDQRRRSPKYQNFAKEFTSREWQRIRVNFSEKLMQISNSEKVVDKYKVRDLLPKPPFLIDTYNPLNKER